MARIMVVEDEPITAADLEQKLTTLGHDVLWLDTGEDAVARAKTDTQDLVLMDIRLRGALSGIDAARQLRQSSDVPIVFVTAFADPDTVKQACEAQPHGYLLKPFTSGSVATTVQVALARAQTELARAERERWVSAALDSVGEAIITVDAAGAIRFVNAQGEALLNMQAQEMIGRDAFSLLRFATAESDDSAHPLAVALKEGRLTSSADRALLPSDGSPALRVSYSAAPILTPHAAKTGAVLVFRRAPTDWAPDARALTALNEVSMRLAHEINNPLTYNLAALQLAIADLDRLRAVRRSSPDPSSETAVQEERELVQIGTFLRDAEQGAKRVAAVVRELNSFALADRTVEPVHPRELVDLALGLSRLDEISHVRVTRAGGRAPMVRGNKWQLSSVLCYGFTSAVDALERRGMRPIVVLVDLRMDARGWALLRVTATSDPSSTTAGPAGAVPAAAEIPRATSVSASVAAHVIERHGAELNVSNQADEYRFELCIPPSQDASTDPSARRGRVLVVDDEPIIGRVLRIALASAHDVVNVTSAERALELFATDQAFDVILCDLSMPRMGGRALYEELRVTHPELAPRLLFMSGGAIDERDKSFIRGMSGRYLEKPFGTDVLLALIDERVRAR